MDAAEPTLPKTVKMSGKDTSKHPLPEETTGSVPSLLRCLESLKQDGIKHNPKHRHVSCCRLASLPRDHKALNLAINFVVYLSIQLSGYLAS